MERDTRFEDKGWIRTFFLIWIGQAFSLAGSRIVQFALVWWLTARTGSATVLATATMVALIPEILLGPIAGAYVDRWNRKRVMIVADAVIALASLWLAYQFWAGTMQVWYVYVVMLVRAMGNIFHSPAMAASTSLLVPKEHLARVAGANQTLNGTLSIVGAPLGALLMSLMPLHFVMLVDVGTAMLAICPLFFVHIPQPERADAGQPASIWADLKEGVRYLRGWKGMMALVGLAMIFKFALTPAFSLLPLLVSEHFQGGAGEYSLIEAASGVGILVGGLLLSVWGGFHRKIFTMLAGVLGVGVAVFILGLLPGQAFRVAVGMLFLGGFMVPIVDGPFMALMQSSIAPEMQGRVLSLAGSLLWLTSPFSLAVAGPVSDALGLQIWYLAAGGLCIAAALIGTTMPVIRNIESEEYSVHQGREKSLPVEVEA
jgi:DHA3 family macrolide efflux protein-like MFS transporter